MLKIYDTKAAVEIINARLFLMQVFSDGTGVIRRAQLSKRVSRIALTAQRAMQEAMATAGVYKMINEDGDEDGIKTIDGDDICQPGLEYQEFNDRVEVFLNDVIDDLYGVSAKQYSRVIGVAGDRPIVNKINTPGGLVNEARTINSYLREHATRTGEGNISRIMGMAASAGTTIALGLPKLEMHRGTDFMIHNCWGTVSGNRNQLLELAKDFERTDRNIASDYVAKTGKSMDEVLAMMDAETFMDVDGAMNHGFADAMAGEPDYVPAAQPVVNKIDPQPTPDPAPSSAAVAFRKELAAELAATDALL